MTAPVPATSIESPQDRPRARFSASLRWLQAAVQSTRPRQWPKNLLVFAAPLAGDTLGRDDGFGYALLAAAVFTAAASAVYLVNDVVDADRDRQHPYKRFRPVAAGRLPKRHAIALAACCIVAAAGAGFWISEPWLTATVVAYLVISFLYSAGLKHVPVAELGCVASGFVLRVLGGAAATHVPPSASFLVVCSLGALMVAVAKRFTELTVLGQDAAAHRPAMRHYSAAGLRATQRVLSVAMIAAYLLWSATGHDSWATSWHLASCAALVLALLRFDRLTARATSRPVEDLITRDPLMIGCELAWLALFAVAL